MDSEDQTHTFKASILLTKQSFDPSHCFFNMWGLNNKNPFRDPSLNIIIFKSTNYLLLDEEAALLLTLCNRPGAPAELVQPKEAFLLR